MHDYHTSEEVRVIGKYYRIKTSSIPDRVRGGALKKEHDHADNSSRILHDDNTVDDPFSKRVREQDSIQKDSNRDVRERVCHHPKGASDGTQFERSRLLLQSQLAGMLA